jgi:ribosomal protein S18 acetylase RimI-like enzyme
MDSVEALRAYYASGPWRVRVTDRGEAALLGRWKAHLDVLAIRGLWCSERHVRAFVEDASAVARVQGFGRLLSPLLPTPLIKPYRACGLEVVQCIVAIQGQPGSIARAQSPAGVRIRQGGAPDVPALAVLDAECFDEFWRWDEEDLLGFLGNERLALAETDSGELIGYTLATVSRGAATLTRLGTAPAHRRSGVAKALVSEVADWSARVGASTFALCTQEENAASRALYVACGLQELDERYVFAMGEV